MVSSKVTTEKYNSYYGPSYDSDGNSSFTEETKITTTEDNGKFKVGLSTAIGTSYAISDALSVYGEISGLITSFTAKSGEYVEYNENGVDVLNLKNPNERYYDFVDKVDSDSAEDEKSTYRTPASSVGFKVGVMVKF